jgi:hypothetical protein
VKEAHLDQSLKYLDNEKAELPVTGFQSSHAKIYENSSLEFQ